MNPKNKLAEMPIRPLLYTMAVPLMLSLLSNRCTTSWTAFLWHDCRKRP